MNRKFAPITVAELSKKINAVIGDGDVNPLLDKIWPDIKVEFDTENVSYSNDDFGPKPLLGYRTEKNGLTYYGFCAGGDWESPVYFIVYWDGKRLRGYVPTAGNPWNTDTKRAFGNDDVADLRNAQKRWPNIFDAAEVAETDDFSFNADEIRDDILKHLAPAKEAAMLEAKDVNVRVSQPPPLRSILTHLDLQRQVATLQAKLDAAVAEIAVLRATAAATPEGERRCS